MAPNSPSGAFDEQAAMPGSVLTDLPGGQALFDWFGRVPRIHDA